MTRGEGTALALGGAALVTGIVLAFTDRRSALGAVPRQRDTLLLAVRGDITGSHKGASWFEKADWKWVRKQKYLKPEKLKITVLAYRSNDQPPDHSLDQEFTGDSLAAARSYAKQLIKDDIAVYTSINMLAWFYKGRDEGWHLVEAESYEATTS